MLFSIIVANYNNGTYLPQLIESVRNQTYSQWQLIIVDDCSTDQSKKILEPILFRLRQENALAIVSLLQYSGKI